MGKSQQRVAGNAKPSSSGRIRELLDNTHGTGNIITFSALSNKPLLKPSKTIKPQTDEERFQDRQKQQIEEAALKSAEPKQKINAQTNEQKKISEENESSPSKPKPALVVRRVGNRDYFTRVKFSEEIPDDKSVDTVCLSGGVYKSGSLGDGTLDRTCPTIDFESKLPSSQLADEDNSTVDDCDENSEDSESELDEGQDLDTMLDRVTDYKDSSTSSSVDSINELADEQAAKEAAFIKLLRVLIRDHNQDLSIEEWDVVVSSVYRWVACITKSQLPFESPVQTKLCVSVLKFINHLIQMAKRLKEMSNLEKEFPMMHSIISDWNSFHSSNVYQDLVLFYLKIISNDSNLSHNDDRMSIIEGMAQIIIEVDPKLVILNEKLITEYLEAKIEFDPELNMLKDSRYCDIDPTKSEAFIAICGLLRSNHRVVLVPAHVMLQQSMSSVCGNIDTSTIITDQDDNIEDIPMLPPSALMAILTSRDSMMSALLSDYKAGDTSVTIIPNTDSYGCTLSYLYAWDLVIQFIVGLDKELVHRVIHSLKKLGLIQRLLDNVFMLLPPLGERDSLNLKMPKAKHEDHRTLSEFLQSPLRTAISRPVNEIELAALHVYFSVASHMPVTVRKWFNNNSNKRLCNLVNEYTVKHVSNIICALEMGSVQEKCQKRANNVESKNLVIKARPSAREVYAMYIRDEFKMELTIKLPVNYPLGPVQIDGGKRVGVTDLKWRSWLLQLTTFLSHQNGPILDGIDLWRRNIDKKFEGIEKCTICFSILHSNYQLPKKKCQVCTKMFHNLCLYKWFDSSGNSTCPLCRNPWL